jgi:hypothetical protein
LILPLDLLYVRLAGKKQKKENDDITAVGYDSHMEKSEKKGQCHNP